MDMAMQEIPLTLFTTFAPMGAGAFITLFVAFFANMYDEKQLKRVDRFTIIPVIVAILGLACSFAHLANPGNAMNVMNTIGSTPLANEVFWFGVFFVLALVYWIVAIAGGLKSGTVRKVFSGIVAIAGAVSVYFMATAYAIPAIPIWDSPKTIVQICGAWLFGGVLLGMFVCSMSGKNSPRVSSNELTCKILMLLGAILLAASTIMFFVTGSNEVSAIMDTGKNADSLMGPFIGSLVFTVIGAACGFFGKKNYRPALFAIATVCAGVAIFLARMVFYGMQIGIGL